MTFTEQERTRIIEVSSLGRLVAAELWRDYSRLQPLPANLDEADGFCQEAFTSWIMALSKSDQLGQETRDVMAQGGLGRNPSVTGYFLSADVKQRLIDMIQAIPEEPA